MDSKAQRGREKGDAAGRVGVDTLKLRQRRADGAALVLTVHDPWGQRNVTLPTSGDLVIGREEDADVRIDMPSVSRRHAKIRGGAVVAIEDLGSTNGTWVNGAQITPGQFVVLEEGSALRFGDIHAVVARVELSPRDAADQGPDEVVVTSAKMRAVHDRLRMFARSDCPILILGETGVGKEVYSSIIVEMSPRASKPFLRINCAALPKDMVESELFGHERGAFTGAQAAKQGLLESAHGGTVLLDETGELSLGTQAKLLRALESGEILRLGAVRSHKVDVRILAATNRNLAEMVQEGSFRADLYYRLAGAEVVLPPLRERMEDLDSLTATFLQKSCANLGIPTKTLTPGARARLAMHTWPGNVRELKSTIQRAVLIAQGSELREEHIVFVGHAVAPTVAPPPLSRGEIETAVIPLTARKVRPAEPTSGEPEDFYEQRRAKEKAAILAALEASGGNQTQAARALDMPRRTLVKRLTEYGIRAPRRAESGDGED